MSLAGWILEPSDPPWRANVVMQLALQYRIAQRTSVAETCSKLPMVDAMISDAILHGANCDGANIA